MTGALISLDNVSVRYTMRKSFFRWHEFVALKSVSFDIKKGETLGVIGGNGSGKSTLLRVLANIYSPDEGKILRFSSSASLLSLSLGFDQELSGRENAFLSGLLQGSSKKVVSSNMDKIVEFSELGSFIDEPVKTYSSGMRARLGFSISTVLKTDLLLIDEVLGVGDAQFRKKAEDSILARINSSQTVVLVSHSLGQIKKVCDRVLWLERGSIIDIGPCEEVVNAYQAFVDKASSKD